MFPGNVMKITFEFTGPSVQAVLDRLPTAKVIEKDGNKSIITAEVNYGRGIIMYLLSQGNWVVVPTAGSWWDDMKGRRSVKCVPKMLSCSGRQNLFMYFPDTMGMVFGVDYINTKAHDRIYLFYTNYCLSFKISAKY